MMEKRTPLHRRLRRGRHKRVARLQDMIVEALYQVFPRSVLHGGTAIWRCYFGNRFSEDVDVYIDKDTKKIDRFFEGLKRAGFKVLKKRMTSNSLFSVLSFESTEVRFEALFKNVRGIVKEYETYEGILFNVFTLNPDEIVREKISAYLKRRKIRDLYDIFFMLRYSEKEGLQLDLQKLLHGFKDPVDEEELRALIMFGAIPTKDDMLEYIRRFVK
jgi:predicted nucleotidyltransferase component of viral defense system